MLRAAVFIAAVALSSHLVSSYQTSLRLNLQLPIAPPPEYEVQAIASTTDAGVPPVPTASKCIVIICCQYMIVITALAICRSYHEFKGTDRDRLHDALHAASQTLTYGPMICVLFIACRMRVEFLSNGKDEPHLFVQNCMYAVTFASLASTLLVLCSALLTGEPIKVMQGDKSPGRLPVDAENTAGFYALNFARYLILLGLYGGLAGIIVGINVYLPPGENDLTKLPAPAPAVMCTMILSVVFFAIQLIIAFCRTYKEFTGQSFERIERLMEDASTTVEFAPMLAILFLAARMRALQHDSQPQVWAQQCMYGATFALILTAVLAILVPLLAGGETKFDEDSLQAVFVVNSPSLSTFLVAVRFFCMFFFYGGAFGVIHSIFTFEAPGGPAATAPVSPTVACVVNLTCQFFFVYLVMTIAHTASILSEELHSKMRSILPAMQAAKSTLELAPMLSILFVTTRMYALLITDKQGAPPVWCQTGMFMATWSLMISFMSALCAGLIMEKVKQDEDGHILAGASGVQNQRVVFSLTALRYFTMALLYGGIVMVIFGLFTMTPETANGYGTPVAAAPPGPNDVAKNVKDAVPR